MSARNDKEAISSALGGGLLYVPVSLLFFLIGTGLFVYYQVHDGALPAEFSETGMSDRVFPYFIVHVMPPGLTGLLIASIFAAGMSTISTSLNSSATVILNDYFKRFKKDLPESQSVKILYVSSALISFFGIAISFILIRAESALSVWWNLSGIFSGGMLGIFLLGYLSGRTRKLPAIIAVALGLLTIIYMSLSPVYFTGALESLKNPLHSYMTIVAGTLVIFFTGLLLTWIFDRRMNKKNGI